MLKHVVDQRKRDIGGFEVGRLLPAPVQHMVGPFIFLDHMGPANFAPGKGMDVRPHPHIGLATVTYLFEGEIFHRDSLGSAEPIRPHEVNWMTAGRGITHSERTVGAPRTNGGPLHGIQSWVALPDEEEEREPNFSHHGAEDLPLLEEGGMSARLIAGTAYGLANNVETYSPLFYLHADLAPGARVTLPTEHEERAAFIVDGRAAHDGRSYEAGQLLIFGGGDAPELTAPDGPCRLMLLGGALVGERYIWWNLVSSRAERIRAAKADWGAGKFKLPPGDEDDFIPAPDIPPTP